MVNPTISRKTEQVYPVSEMAKKLFQVIYNEKNKETQEDDIPKIKVSSLISKMSFYYEKIRNTVDYKEEHLLRKNAILRILKRQIVIEGAIQEIKTDAVAKHLLVELIRAGYLPNNEIPETKINEVNLIIGKYLKLREYAFKDFKKDNFNSRNDLMNWILSIAASDIEEKLGRAKVDQLVINDIYEILTKAIKLPDDSPYESDREIQIYIGIHRNLLKFDGDMIGFILFKYYNEDWQDLNDERIAKIGSNIDALCMAVKKQLDHPLSGQLNRIISRYTVYFSILTDVIGDNPVVIYNSFKDDPKYFPREIKKICNRRYAFSRKKLWRAAVRSILYIFITKSVFAVLLEVPASKLFGETVNNFALMINITFPALLLFLIVLFTSLPSDNNTERITEGINRIVFKGYKDQEPIILREPVRRNTALNSVFSLIYGATFLTSIGLIVWGLLGIGFNYVSIIIFLFFLAFVSFFAIRIRKGAHELVIIEAKESIVRLLSDFFYIPIVGVGKWLSEKFSRINVFVFILDFIIEAPFKIFIEIAEEWTKYVKERRDEIV